MNQLMIKVLASWKLFTVGLIMLSSAYFVEALSNRPEPPKVWQHERGICSCATCLTVRRMDKELLERRLPDGELKWAGPRQ